jgi:signal transduction histidine kinase
MGRIVSAKTEGSSRPEETQDETERRLLALLEAALEEKDALERELARAGGDNLNARLRSLAHELRGPLNSIIGFAEVIRGRVFGDDLDRYVEYAGDIHASGLHLLELIETELHPMADAGTGEKIDAVEVAAGSLRLIRLKAAEAGIALIDALAPPPVEVRAKPRALRQILINLLENALKFTPRGGRITLGLSVEGSMVRIAVDDTGIGIPAAEITRIFERDYRIRSDPRHLRAGGSGLGLAIARDLARRMGGELTVESAPDQGARFTLTLPRADT